MIFQVTLMIKAVSRPMKILKIVAKKSIKSASLEVGASYASFPTAIAIEMIDACLADSQVTLTETATNPAIRCYLKMKMIPFQKPIRLAIILRDGSYPKS